MRGHIKEMIKNKKYYIRVYRGLVDGKKKYHCEMFNGTLRQAESRLNEILGEISTNTFVDPSKMTFGAFLDNWLANCPEVSASKGTYEWYKGVIENHIKKDPIGKISITKLSSFDIQNYITRTLKKKRVDGKPGTLSPGTVKNHLGLIKTALKTACVWRVIRENPAEYVQAPKVQKYNATALTEEQAARFLDLAANDRYYFLYLLAIYYGKRKGEIRGLRRQDVDLNTLTACIRQSVRKSGYSAEYKDTKTKESNKILQLEEWMKPLFEKEFERRDYEKEAAGNDYNDNGLVFAAYTGNPVKESNLEEHFNKIIKEAGLPEIRFHDLRHSCASILLRRGTNLKLAQERLSHTDIKTTANIYSHVIPTMQREVNQTMTNALRLQTLH
jgi:integrase